MKHKAIIMHGLKPRMILCELCDHTTEETDKWYEYEIFHSQIKCSITHTALDCCKHKLEITDWKEEKTS